MKAYHRYQFEPKENKLIRQEINKQIIENARKHEIQTEAVFLLAVREVFGCGAGKLQQVYDKIYHGYRELLQHYEMDNEDAQWLVCRKLKEIGADVERWHHDWEQKNKK